MAIAYPNPKIDRRLRQLGLRLTPQRELILRAVAACGEHATLDEIYTRVHKQAPNISPATVYRNLELFGRNRVIYFNEMAGGKVYELVSDDGHHHLICQKCWADIKLPDEQVQALFNELNEQTGFLVLGEHYIFMGLCPHCRREEGDAPGPISVFPKFRHTATEKGAKNQ